VGVQFFTAEERQPVPHEEPQSTIRSVEESWIFEKNLLITCVEFGLWLGASLMITVGLCCIFLVVGLSAITHIWLVKVVWRLHPSLCLARGAFLQRGGWFALVFPFLLAHYSCPLSISVSFCLQHSLQWDREIRLMGLRLWTI